MESSRYMYCVTGSFLSAWVSKIEPFVIFSWETGTYCFKGMIIVGCKSRREMWAWRQFLCTGRKCVKPLHCNLLHKCYFPNANGSCSLDSSLNNKMQSSRSQSRWKRIVSKWGLTSPNRQSSLLITERAEYRFGELAGMGSGRHLKWLTDYAELEKVSPIVFHFISTEFPVSYKLQWSSKLWQGFLCPNFNISFGAFVVLYLRAKPIFLSFELIFLHMHFKIIVSFIIICLVENSNIPWMCGMNSSY